ncbi:MAG: UDP-3-O-(3-hydroxymyristoyl)glucosamine N-acyltransferase [Chlorobi bacterium]|nr:UDP-3-O-(3-hydroxymyristoyl)glucosamine N-acyltransferase [Chlorobiota bacterium]
MNFKASQIAEILQGKVEGDPDSLVNDFSKIEESKENSLTFLANPKYEKYIYTTKASVVLVNDDFKPEKDISATLIRVPNAYKALATLLEFYEKSMPQKTGIEQPSFIHESAVLGDSVYVGAFAYIGENAKIGDNVKIYPQAYIGDNVVIEDNSIIYAGVKIYHGCKIGKNCIIHAGAVIGSDGFGFAPDETGEYKKIQQIGIVILEQDVEIGANTCIDRATMGETVVRKGAKLDNLIQIAHNVDVGSRTVMAAQVGVAGSTKIGKECMMGGQVGLAGHLTVPDRVKFGAQSGVPNSVKKEGETLLGSPAINVTDFAKSFIIFKKLPDIYRQINEMEKTLKNITNE